MTISIGELQRNISILKNLKEPLEVVDKRTKKVIAVIYPKKKNNIVQKLAGSLKSDVVVEDLESAIEKAKYEHLKEKYGFSD